MNRPNTTIMDYVMMSKKILKSTSSLSELHIIAFRCLILENLPISRILPPSDLPRDDDETMMLVIKYLSDSEDNVRSGSSIASLGSATVFYQQLQVVLRQSGTPPDTISIPRSLRQSSLFSVFPSVPESDTTTSTDSSFEPSQEHRPSFPDRPRSSMDITDSQTSHPFLQHRLPVPDPERPPSSMDITDSQPSPEKPSTGNSSTESSTGPKPSMESHNMNTSSSSGEEDKLTGLPLRSPSRQSLYTTAEFHPDYFSWVRQGKIPKCQCLVFRRSSSYDLSRPDSRREACRAIIAVMRRISQRAY